MLLDDNKVVKDIYIRTDFKLDRHFGAYGIIFVNNEGEIIETFTKTIFVASPLGCQLEAVWDAIARVGNEKSFRVHTLNPHLYSCLMDIEKARHKEVEWANILEFYEGNKTRIGELSELLFRCDTRYEFVLDDYEETHNVYFECATWLSYEAFKKVKFIKSVDEYYAEKKKKAYQSGNNKPNNKFQPNGKKKKKK